MENIIVVGTGDVFHRFIAPALEILETQNLLKVILTVDIKPREPLEYLSEKIEHRVRVSGEDLDVLLDDLKDKNPIVILAHDNDLHYADAKKLVEAGFRVMLEKPYVINQVQLENLSELISANPQKIFLMEYYLMRKMTPLFLLAGIIKPESFYLSSEEVFRGREANRDLSFYNKKMKEIIGDPLSIDISILESQGDSGKLDHRGAHVFDIRRGGGMLQDMGIHALMPLFVLEDYLGEIDKSFKKGEIKIAGSKEFYNLSKAKYNLPLEFIGETYAEVSFSTSLGIPVKITVGKYIADAPTQKNVILRGTKGKLDLNMHENFMHIYKGHQLIDKIELINTKRNRYYPVIMAGLEYFKGKNPFSIDLSKTQLDSQELILKILRKSREGNSLKIYNNGERKEVIFTPEEKNNVNVAVSVVTFSKNKELVKELSKSFPNYSINELGRRFTEEELIDHLKDADAAITGLDDINENVLSQCSKLEVIAKHGIGTDQIDFDVCKKHNVKVITQKGTNRRSVSELVLAFMLGLIRGAYTSSSQLKEGEWNKYANNGMNLTGKTIGIIGVGNIGKDIALLLKPFNCKILVNDLRQDAEQLNFYKEHSLTETSKEEIFKKADILTIHTPLTPLTEKMIGKKELSMMKPDSFIINTARGKIINEEDLLWALENKIIAGAGLDVFSIEPPENKKLLSLKNVYCTPHIGGTSKEASWDLGVTAINNLKDHFGLD